MVREMEDKMTELDKFIRSIGDGEKLYDNSPLIKYLECLPKERTPKVIITSTPHMGRTYLYDSWLNSKIVKTQE